MRKCFRYFTPAAFEWISKGVIAGLINISPARLPSFGKVSNFRCRLMLQVGGLLLRNLCNSLCLRNWSLIFFIWRGAFSAIHGKNKGEFLPFSKSHQLKVRRSVFALHHLCNAECFFFFAIWPFRFHSVRTKKERPPKKKTHTTHRPTPAQFVERLIRLQQERKWLGGELRNTKKFSLLVQLAGETSNICLSCSFKILKCKITSNKFHNTVTHFWKIYMFRLVYLFILHH